MTRLTNISRLKFCILEKSSNKHTEVWKIFRQQQFNKQLTTQADDNTGLNKIWIIRIFCEIVKHAETPLNSKCCGILV